MDPTATVIACALAGLGAFGCLPLLVWLVRPGAGAQGAKGSLPTRREEAGCRADEGCAPRRCCLWLPETTWSEDPESAGDIRRRAFVRWERLRDEVETVRRAIGV